MAADGEVEIAVRAEGADRAAKELAEGAEAQPGGTRRQGRLSEGLKGGLLGGIVVGLLGNILDVLDPILKIFQAFLAPVAVLLLRMLTPVLRFMLRLLPAWMDFINAVMPMAADVGKLLGRVAALATIVGLIPKAAWERLKQGFEWVRDKVGEAINWLRSLPRRIWEFIQRLPALIGNVIAANVPGAGLAGDVSSGGRDLVNRGREFIEDPGGTVVNITGGLETFVENIERESGFDLPF